MVTRIIIALYLHDCTAVAIMHMQSNHTDE